MPKKRLVPLTVNFYAIVSRAVEEGVSCGWRRAHKHTATPSEEAVCLAMEIAVMEALSEVVKWE